MANRGSGSGSGIGGASGGGGGSGSGSGSGGSKSRKHSSKPSYPDGKVTFIDLKDVDEVVEFHFGDDIERAEKYLQSLTKINVFCSSGRTDAFRKLICQKNEKKPLILFIIKFNLNNEECESKLIIEKATVFILCFTVGKNTWKHCDDSLYAVVGSKKAGFCSSYQSIKHEVKNIGPGSIYSALSTLQRAEHDPLSWKKSFKVICHHFPEACRFLDIANVISQQMNDNHQTSLPLQPRLKALITNWEHISNSLKAYVKYLREKEKEKREKGEVVNDNDKKAIWVKCLGSETVVKTGLETVEDAVQSISILH